MTVVVVGFCGIMLAEMIMVIILADMRLVIDSSSSGHLRNGKWATQVDLAGRPNCPTLFTPCCLALELVPTKICGMANG